MSLHIHHIGISPMPDVLTQQSIDDETPLEPKRSPRTRAAVPTIRSEANHIVNRLEKHGKDDVARILGIVKLTLGMEIDKQ